MFFKNWNVITKVIVSFALATAFFIVVGIVGISTNSALYVFGIIALGVVVAIFIATYLYKTIHSATQKTLQFTREVASGNFSRRAEITIDDEFGQIQMALNEMADKLENMLVAIAGYARQLAETSVITQKLAEDFSSRAQDMNEHAAGVASASEELSVNMTAVSAATEEASTNIGVVASNTEEMTATFSEITANSEQAKHITNDAVHSVRIASDKVNELGENARAISNIVDVIMEIAGQTKLLALNATIEAARAGEAGKGFSVVANEVKELANQTGDATEEIEKSISAIQASSADTVNEIGVINKVIGKVDTIVSSIASAVEEQNTTTKDITSNISQASEGMRETAQNVAQSSEASQMIARDILQVSSGSERISTESNTLTEKAQILDAISQELKQLIQGFTFSE